MKTPLDLSTPLAALPHGPEFKFLDQLTRLAPGLSGAGTYRVRGDEPFLRGHFPGAPIMPGVLVLEAAAQLAGVVAQSDPSTPPIPNLMLTALRSVKFFGSAKPGELVEFEAHIAGRFGNMVQADVRASVLGTTILEGSVVLSAAEQPL